MAVFCAIFGDLPTVSAQTPQAAAQLKFDPFWVRGVPVDVTAGSVTEARDRSQTEGRVAAFRRLVDRMVMPVDAGKIEMPSTNQIIEMIYEFSVTNERSSAVRYLADMNVRFNPNAVRAYLRTQNVPFAETASRPLVVIPVLQEGGATVLWQDGNAWKDAWVKLMPHDGLVPMVMPLGDLDDVTLLSAEQAIAKDAAALKRIADKYGAVGAIVAVANMSQGGNVTVSVADVRALGAPWDGRASSTAALGAIASREEAFTAAAIDAARAVEDGWKQRNIMKFGQGGKITTLIPVTSLADWSSIKTRLSQIPVVERVDMQAISRALVQAVITFAGDEAQLQFALNQRELNLEKDGDMWLLRALTREPQSPVPPTAAPAPGQ
ncbi:MAG: DUF2066 domain-containing protein [Rhodospirillaceae bacterium]|nr:DUF2066 domain-containing protein [Rhodospirillaceae bacterium]